jgi:hypothetical protein
MVTEKDTQYPSANVVLERLLETAREAGLPKSEAVNQAHTTPSGVRPHIEVVADLLMAARMACSDLPPDARSALRTLLLVIAMLCKEGTRIERDIQDLISAASMACAELPREKGSALRTLLRIASRELSDVPTATRPSLAATREPDAMGDRDEAPSQMAPDEIAEAQRMAREWRPRNRPL